MDKILFQYISIINDFISRKTKNIDKLVIPTTFIIPAPGKLTIQNNLPFGSPKGILKNMPRDTMPEFLCGTGVEEIRSGKYKFDIKAFIGTDYYMLNWAEHK